LWSVAGPDWAAVCTDAEGCAEWIAALSPAVSPAIEQILRGVAAELDEYGITEINDRLTMPRHAWAALDLAALLGVGSQ
jgi:hypothetical protein